MQVHSIIYYLIIKINSCKFLQTKLKCLLQELLIIRGFMRVGQI